MCEASSFLSSRPKFAARCPAEAGIHIICILAPALCYYSKNTARLAIIRSALVT